MTYHYGRTIVEVFPMVPAHTYGDLVVYLPRHRIMFAGDIAFFYVAPFCQNAHPSNWIEICSRIGQMDVQTIVPGHGPLGGQAELADMRDYLVLLRKEARARYDARMSAGAAAADIRMGKYDNWVGPERIIMDTARFYDEFAGTLRPDVNTAAIRQATEDYNAARKTAGR
jgi:glyoxylase-like metal-dependent hydrolase (beta-lactamase superfamily II)